MTKFKSALLGGLAAIGAIGLSAPALAKHHEGDSKDEATPKEMDESATLTALFKYDDEASMKRNPISALFRGDMRYADQLGDFISDAYFDAEREAAENSLSRLAKIDRSKLNPTEQIAYDVYTPGSERYAEGPVKGDYGPDRGSPRQSFYRLSHFLSDLL